MLSYLLLVLCAATPRPAFPGAVGFGAAARPGVPGRVVHVTSLADSGPGSLRAALHEPGPKVIVFDVGGTVELTSPLQVPRQVASRTTLAGQTAPGGITISGNLWLAGYSGGQRVSDIIVRHMRFRGVHTHFAADSTGDCLVVYQADRVIIDHCSFSGGVDECLDVGGSTNVTVGWSSFEESAQWGEGGSQHSEGAHHRALMIGTYSPQCDWTLHHSFFAHHLNRMPEGHGRRGEMLANVMYNWKPYAGTLLLSGPANVVGNTWIAGPDRNPRAGLCVFYDVPQGPLFWADNQFWGPTEAQTWRAPGAQQPAIIQATLHDYNRRPQLSTSPARMSAWPVTVGECQAEYEAVLARAGTWPRDTTTRRTLAEIRAREGRHGLRGPYERFALRTNGPTSFELDRDGDGIEDAWERRRGLDPRNPRDAQGPVPAGVSPQNRHAGGSYLEWFLNDLAERLIGFETPQISVRVSIEGQGRVVCGHSGRTVGWNPARELRGGPVEVDWPTTPQSFHRGSSAALRALPAAGWRFAGWTGGGLDSERSPSIEPRFAGDTVITARFVPVTAAATP